MRTDKRIKITGGYYTVNLARRKENNLLIQNIEVSRTAFRKIKPKYPFKMDAVVRLPEHLHCIWPWPREDNNYSRRWRLIKSSFSQSIATKEYISKSRPRKQERGIWQRRFWEHVIRDDKDYAYHFDYIHYNPVKHGHVRCVKDWQYSSFHYWVSKGIYSLHWGQQVIRLMFG